MAEAKIKDAIKSRASYKGKITSLLNALNENPTKPALKACMKGVKNNLSKVENLDNSIIDLYASLGKEPDELELKNQALYSLEIETKLIELESNEDCMKVEDSCNVVRNDLKLPHIQCISFNGEESDNLKYYEFITQFNNVIGHRGNLSNATKLTYLKTYLKGYAYKVIQHLQICDENYPNAIKSLEKEFLNKTALVDELYAKLLKLSPDSSSELNTKIYINDVRSIVSDLKNYDRDILGNETALEIVSHIVVHNLPSNFRQELMRKLENNYPNLLQLFEHYVDICKTLNLNSHESGFRPKNGQIAIKNGAVFGSNRSNFETISNNTTVQPNTMTSKYENNRKTSYNPNFIKKSCKFCNNEEHSMINCTKYISHESRINRCKELKMCFKCSSLKHISKNCKKDLDFACKFCGLKNHISALCRKTDFNTKNETNSNYCLNSLQNCPSSHLLPTVSITVSRGNKPVTVRCLVDTGSQRSYIDHSVLRKLKFSLTDYGDTGKDYIINSFIETGTRKLSEACFLVNLDGTQNIYLPFLIDTKFDLKFRISALPTAMENISEHFKLADEEISNRNDVIKLDGLLGIDAIRHFKQFETVTCLKGKAFSISNGIIPFGDIEDFLTIEQMKTIHSQREEKSENNIETSLNFLLNPIGDKRDILGSTINDREVESHLDNLFNVESLRINDDNSSYDEDFIKQFDDSIELKDGHYHV